MSIAYIKTNRGGALERRDPGAGAGGAGRHPETR